MEEAPKVCPFCLNDVTNGIGPSDLPEVTKLLNNLPSSHVFRSAADWHDYLYHLGATEDNRCDADHIFYDYMLEAVEEKCVWFSKWWYRLQAKRNFIAVREFGGNFFNYKGCFKG